VSSTNPMMSVIIIVKNNETLLPRAIESVLAQTQNDLELIIVNDGSTDNTSSIIDSFQKRDYRVQPYHLESNVGRSSARNIGLDASHGKYVTFLDADDYLPETAIADLLSTSEGHQSDIVFAHIKPFDNETGKWLPHHYTDVFMHRERHGIKLQDCPELLYNHSIVGRGFRRDFLNKYGIRFSTQRRNAEDVTFSFYSEFNAQRMSIIPDKTVYYYSVGNFLATANKSKVEDARDSVIETLDFALQNGEKHIINTMHKKSVIFAGNLGRAKEVFGITEELHNFLPSLVPLVNRAPEEIIDTLPPYYQRFARAIRAYDFDRAFYLFDNKYRFDNLPPISEKTASSETALESADSRINRLIAQNQRLAAELNMLYNSTSWQLTRPLRAAINIIRRLAGKIA
jgi:glycosyltransferase involved in cell wall biosynthesis